MAALMADNSAVHHWNLHGAQGGDSLSLCLPRVRDWYRQSGERPVGQTQPPEARSCCEMSSHASCLPS